MSRPIRFGFQLSGEHLDDPVASARRAEELGFDVVTTSDHVGQPRWGDLEFNALVQMCTITDDRDAGLAAACEWVGGLSMADAAVIPYLMIGSVDEIVDHIQTCRDRWGITYFVVRSLDDFAPVLDAFT